MGGEVGAVEVAAMVLSRAEDGAAFSQEMAKVRRTWKSVGFRPFGKDIMVMDPAMVHHGEAVDKLGLPQ
jgi:hypothetical protein